MKIFGIDPGSERTGYGCIETDGSHHRIVVAGAIRTAATASFAEKLLRIHQDLAALLRKCRPDGVAIESIFYAVNARAALKLGHARGVAMLAAVEAGVQVFEYSPAEIKRAVVGYGRAEKPQVQQMVKVILGLAEVPSPHDAADALAVAICHVHSSAHARLSGTAVPARSPAPAKGPGAASPAAARRFVGAGKATNWRAYRPART